MVRDEPERCRFFYFQAGGLVGNIQPHYCHLLLAVLIYILENKNFKYTVC